MAKRVYSVSSRLVAAVERRSLRNGVSVTVSGGAGYAGVSVDLSGKADRVSFEALRDEFESMFERVEREDGSWYILAKRDFLGSGRVSARNGAGGGEGSGGEEPGEGECAGRIADLLDVALGAPLRDGEALVWREGAWRNEAVESGLDEGALGRYLSGHGYVTSGVLAGYATEAWVLGRGYLTEHQDVSGLLPRVEFDEMFERVERADGSWYIRAKADVLGDGRITAHNSSGGGESSEGVCAGRVADLLDVALGAPLRDGEALVWRDGAWRNEAVAGGLDEGALGRYLSGYGYVTSTVLDDYVTVGTEQEITGRKRFGADVTVFNGEARIDGKSGGLDGRPCLMFHIPDVTYAKFVLGDSGALHLLRGGATDFNSYAALGVGSIAVYGGTASQYLMADGSVREQVYFCQDLGNIPIEYINITDYSAGAAGYANYQSGVYTVPLSGHSAIFVNFAKNHSSTSALQLYSDYYDDAPLMFRKTISGNRVGGPWRTLVSELNIGDYMAANASRLDERFVKKAGDTMSGVLTLPYSGLVVNSAGGDTATRILKAYGGGTNNLHYINFGNAPSNGNAGEIMYQFVGDGSADNSVALGFYGGKYVSLTWGGDLRIGSSGSWKKVWNENNDGSGSGLDADLLDGLHGTDFARSRGDMWNSGESVADWAKRVVPVPGIYSMDIWAWAYSANLTLGGYVIDRMRYSAIDFRRGNLNSAWNQKAVLFLPTYADSSMMYIAQMSTLETGGAVTTSVKRYADYDTIINGNVATATRLQTARKIFGVSFDGGADAAGRFELNGVTGGTLSIFDGGGYRGIQSWQSTLLCLNPQGNSVVVGTTSNSSGARLHVNGDVYVAGRITGQNTSDERLKENIRPIEGATGLLRGLGGFFVFDYRAGAGESMRYGRVGLIFQNVRGRFAELMGLMRKDGYGALNYISPDFINLIGASVLEVDGKVAELQREVAELRRENEALKRIVTGKGFIERKGESEA